MLLVLNYFRVFVCRCVAMPLNLRKNLIIKCVLEFSFTYNICTYLWSTVDIYNTCNDQIRIVSSSNCSNVKYFFILGAFRLFHCVWNISQITVDCSHTVRLGMPRCFLLQTSLQPSFSLPFPVPSDCNSTLFYEINSFHFHTWLLAFCAWLITLNILQFQPLG